MPANLICSYDMRHQSVPKKNLKAGLTAQCQPCNVTIQPNALYGDKLKPNDRWGLNIPLKPTPDCEFASQPFGHETIGPQLGPELVAEITSFF